MTFANTEGGMDVCLDKFKTDDLVRVLFAENPGVVVQVAYKHKKAFKELLDEVGVGYVKIGTPAEERQIMVTLGDATYQFGIDYLRDVWYETSYLLDTKQSLNGCATRIISNNRLNSTFTPNLQVSSSNLVLIPTVASPLALRPLSFAKRVPMVSAQWHMHSTWQAST